MTQLILSASIDGPGFHPGAPRPDPTRLADLAHYRDLVLTAERGHLDFVLLGDGRARTDAAPAGRLDALTVLSRLAPETRFVGLAAEVPTTHAEPFAVSRALATLDFVSGGRAAWQASTSGALAEARNYGPGPTPDGQQARAAEFVDVSRKLWDSWEDGAVIADRARGLYLDPERLHHIHHQGQHFRVRGPQLTPRPPQGQVVVVGLERDFGGGPPAAEVADVLVLHREDVDAGARTRADLRAQAERQGRELRVLRAVLPVLAESDAEAQALAEDWEARAAQKSGWPRAQRFVGTPEAFADMAETWVAAGAADGLHIFPPNLPDGLTRFVDLAVPELTWRGLARTAYDGLTLRHHLGLTRPESRYARRTA
ncbi:LLM class flavin-dependent oxidoreductase [Deinococcus hopiensis]|uniref:Flavin-dependent oxidoreductase, luciferase family (Includes alkanesulfonate monooxygenase SsuD and methylene tetrahydromethanopterin reductase) n=1 Tax=Deinococcus hopiensis KR-140 TaxID=695939 RepID=A0A1W1URG1_9DEIO|nr:LLM class flavin-dependent oxidoreductase [Deinococcus hopiensis]SMB83294.1 Flavin-dependent oxidoreductase, luciferase family (includes alkanesulfonate monooxygenase SsuD and methylene tetrahydromethanopterin reductase) [Deinococcus hopiensis KR-140]